uniref:Regulatory protein zeste n=1 Tax=Glossina palpalis gambiensis TaxID=67801 RepID=A0A1B0B7F5_9MUSC
MKCLHKSTSKQQMEIMLSFIEENPEMAQNYNECTAQDRQNINELWDELRTELNSLGYPNKSTSGWRKAS